MQKYTEAEVYLSTYCTRMCLCMMCHVISVMISEFSYHYSSLIVSLFTIDPARIHDYTDSGPNEVSVTDADFEEDEGENVTICCNFTGIEITTATWQASHISNGQDIPPNAYVIQDRVRQTEPTTTPGLSCITFIMSRETQGTYTCCTSNDVIDPPGQKQNITVTLRGSESSM